LDILGQRERISVADICDIFSVSEATARRDLEELTIQKSLRRVRGGAISVRQAPPESPLLMRQSTQIEEKTNIGMVASQLIQDSETVFLGSGTTVLEIAKHLRSRKDLTVVTNSLPVLNAFSGLRNIKIIALGGMLRDSELSFIGYITEQALGEIRVDKVIIGVHAIHLEQGLTNDYLPETMTDRAILKAGKQVIVAADHTKIGLISTAFLAPITSIDIFISDKNAPKKFVESIKTLGIEVLLA
jgi:DeoR family transcriptional regulator of aga operon